MSGEELDKVKDHELKEVTFVHPIEPTLFAAHVTKPIEPNSTCVVKQIDASMIFCIPSPNGSTRWFKTVLGITFERFYPYPPIYVSKRPVLRMLEEPKSEIIVFLDVS